MTVDRTIIDINDALNRALGDATFLKMMFDELVQTIPGLINAIETDIQNADMDQLAKDAHQLKGAASNLSVIMVAAMSYQLEKMAKKGETSRVQEAFDQLKDCVTEFKSNLDSIDWQKLRD